MPRKVQGRPELPKRATYRRTSGKPASEWPIMLRYRDSYGQECHETLPPDTPAKAVTARLREIDNQKEAGTHVARSAGTIKIGKLLDEWIDYEEIRCSVPRKKNHKNRDTIRKYRRIIANHLKPRFCHIALKDLDPTQVQEWLDSLLVTMPLPSHPNAEPHRPRYSPNDIWIYKRPLSMAIDYAVMRHYVHENKLRGYEWDWPEPEDNRVCPTVAEVRLILRALDAPRQHSEKSNRLRKHAFYLAIYAGLRGQEIFGLLWEDIDLDKMVLDIKRVRENDGRIIERTKSKSSRRKVPITPGGPVHIMIDEERRRLEQLGQPLTGPFVKGVRSNRFLKSAMREYHVPIIMKRAGLIKADGKHKYTLHHLRHFCGSAWLADGVRLDKVSTWLGHSSVDFTKKVYIHELEHSEDLARAAMARSASRIMNGMPAALSAPTVGPALPAPDIQPAITTSESDTAEPEATDDRRPPQPAVPLSKGQRNERILELYHKNWSLKDIGKEFGVSHDTICAIVKASRSGGDIGRPYASR